MREIGPGWIIEHYGMTRLPGESTFYASTYRSAVRTPDGRHVSTAMIGLYSIDPPSCSMFHRLAQDEVWHFYAGDPLRLILLNLDGSTDEVIMGTDLAAGHHVQCTVPAGVWQAGEVAPGGSWSLFGCTLAPGFTGELFEPGDAASLLAAYPRRRGDIERLATADPEGMPPGFV